MKWNMNVTSHANVVDCAKKLIQARRVSFRYINLSASIEGTNTMKGAISFQMEISVINIEEKY